MLIFVIKTSQKRVMNPRPLRTVLNFHEKNFCDWMSNHEIHKYTGSATKIWSYTVRVYIWMYVYSYICMYVFPKPFLALTLGFTDAVRFHNGSEATETLPLPLAIKNNGTTEINITIEFSAITGTTATVGQGRFHFCQE